MNTVNMPGFTATATLYRTSGHYGITPAQTIRAYEIAVIAQSRRVPECNRNCICRSPFDCPCCESIVPFND
jgi:hypothetical protein